MVLNDTKICQKMNSKILFNIKKYYKKADLNKKGGNCKFF